MKPFFKEQKDQKNSSGFTLIEVLIVVALMSLVYSMVLPQFSTNASLAFDSLSRLSNDVRSAFDTAILTGKNHRLVFDMKSGKYWLEVTDAEDVFLPEKREDQQADLNQTILEEKEEEFESRFEKYKDLAGEAVKDDEDDTEIEPPSPVMKAKEKLRGPKWVKVQNLEWNVRQMTDVIVMSDIKAEHHSEPLTYENLASEEEALITVQINPTGRIEQTIMHFYYRNNDNEPDFDKAPFTFYIHPTLGMGTYVTGLKELGEDGELNESEFL